MSPTPLHRRSEWTTAPLPGHSKVGAWDGYIAHHFYRPDVAAGTATAERDTMRAIDKVHADNGWGGIGYAWVIFQTGRLWEGRGWSRTGAHTEGQNSKLCGVAFAIDGDARPPSLEAWLTFVDLVRLGEQAGLVEHNPKLYRHHDFAPKSCPGQHVGPARLGFARGYVDRL